MRVHAEKLQHVPTGSRIGSRCVYFRPRAAYRGPKAFAFHAVKSALASLPTATE